MEVGTLELDHSEVSFLQVSLNKIDSSEVRNYLRVLHSPLVPFLDRFLKKRGMFLRMGIYEKLRGLVEPFEELYADQDVREFMVQAKKK